MAKVAETEMRDIVARAAIWAGSEEQALAWYRSQPIAAFGGKTAEELVEDDKGAAVREYLDHISSGGFG